MNIRDAPEFEILKKLKQRDEVKDVIPKPPKDKSKPNV